MVSGTAGSTIATGQPAHREGDGGEAEERGGAVVVGVAHGPSAVGRSALAGVTGEGAALVDQVIGAVAAFLGGAALLSLLLLPVFKGAFVGLQWAKRMHGFGGDDPHLAPDPRHLPAADEAAR